LDFESPVEAVLKGHGLSRAETGREKRNGFSRWGMFFGRKPIPQGLKARENRQERNWHG
jgi:hypothetical protein